MMAGDAAPRATADARAAKRRRWRRVGLWAGAGLVGVASSGALAGWLWLRSSLPRLSGSVEVAGLEQPIEIVRDASAVPHVLARTEADAYFGLGYAHAQDRLWQLEVNRRIGSGRLAEVLGERALRRDRLFRTLGLRAVAEQNLRHMNEPARRALAAYAAGVNSFLVADPALPPEFGLLQVEPEPWSPVDSLIWLKVMAWTLSGNMDRELDRWRLSRHLSPLQLAEFVSPYPGDEPPVLTNLPGIFEAAGAATGQNELGRAPPDSLGSNNWAVDGRRTESGKPLLANDPHLSLTSPSLWYLAHLQAPGLDVIGATLPSLPGVILGRTASAAWAFTNTGSDVQDVYLERLVPGQPDRYETPEGSAAFEVRHERIVVRGGASEQLLVRVTRHGPVVSDVYPPAAQLVPAGYVLAFRWAALEPDDRSFEFVTEVAHAQDADDVLAAARHLDSPTQNVVYADSQGNIGFVAAGRVPVRSSDNPMRGMLPALGWDARHEWQGYLPFEQLPQLHNPSTGRLVTANQKIVPEGYPHWLGSEWKDPARARRIESLLDAVPRHSVESFGRMQTDIEDGTARMLLAHMLSDVGAPERRRRDGEARFANAALPRPAVGAGVGPSRTCATLDAELVQTALARLEHWDLQMDAERPEALIFSAWVRELTRGVYADELGPEFEQQWAERPVFLVNVLSDRRGQGRWCDDTSTLERETCTDQLHTALCRGLALLVERHGSTLENWRWGAAHVARSRHVPLSAVPLLSSWFDVTTPSPGGSHSVNAGAFPLDDEALFENHHGAAFRAVYDLGDPERSRFMLRTGQSGHVLSPHYRDLAASWLRGESVPMTTRREAFARGALGTLRLLPMGSPAKSR